MNVVGQFLNSRFILVGMILVFFATFYCNATMAAQPEKLKIKGIMPGMTIEQIEEVVPGFAEKCAILRATKADEICTYRAATNRMFEPAHLIPIETFADITPISWSFFGSEGVVKSLSVALSTNNFLSVADALSAKYGKPKITNLPVHNKMGAKFENTKLSWTRGTQTLFLERYGLDLETSLVLLTDTLHKSVIKPPSKDL